MKTHICNLFCQHQMDQVYVCLVSFSLHFIHAVCLTVSLSLFPLSELMGKYSKASREEQCGIRRLRSKIRAASRRCRHSTNKKLQKKTHLDRRRRRAQQRQRMLANKIATHTIKMMTQAAPLLRPPLPHQNGCSMQPFAQKNSITRSIAEDPAIAEYITQA